MSKDLEKLREFVYRKVCEISIITYKKPMCDGEIEAWNYGRNRLKMVINKIDEMIKEEETKKAMGTLLEGVEEE